MNGLLFHPLLDRWFLLSYVCTAIAWYPVIKLSLPLCRSGLCIGFWFCHYASSKTTGVWFPLKWLVTNIQENAQNVRTDNNIMIMSFIFQLIVFFFGVNTPITATGSRPLCVTEVAKPLPAYAWNEWKNEGTCYGNCGFRWVSYGPSTIGGRLRGNRAG